MLIDKPMKTPSENDHVKNRHSHLNAVQEELKLANPYISILISQLKEVIKETESGVLIAIDKANALDASYKSSVDYKHQGTESLEILTDLLGGLQFQDVVRQRLEQICKALVQFDEHLAQLSEKLGELNWDGVCKPSLKEKIECFSDEYVMFSQVEAHLKVAKLTHKAHKTQSVELF